MSEITAQAALEFLTYDPETGHFRWRARPNRRIRVGARAGSLQPHGYVRVCLAGRPYLAHRLAWLFVHGEWPSCEIDHINGDRMDNRIANLREATPAQQRQNANYRPNRTGVRGVQEKRGRFSARIRIEGRSRCLGTFATAEAAGKAYGDAKLANHPFATARAVG